MSRVISVLCAVGLLALLAAPSASAQPPAKAKSSKKANAKPKEKPNEKRKAKPKERRAKGQSTACKKGESRASDGTCAKSLIFGDGDDIEGDTPHGYGDFMTATRAVDFAGLIRLRTNFHVEILKSASEL